MAANIVNHPDPSQPRSPDTDLTSYPPQTLPSQADKGISAQSIQSDTPLSAFDEASRSPIASSLKEPSMQADGQSPAFVSPRNSKTKSGKKSRGVRFQTDDGDIVVPEKVNHLERRSTRSKASDALDYLLEGNKRFREGRLERCKGGPEIVAETADDIAKPSTIILSCSDSRVPPEIVCDMGLGDCHVVRVGGNVVNDFILGSIIFAVQHLNCSLVVVMAHSRCSVVASAVQNWARSKSNLGHENEARSLAETVQKTLGNSPSLASQKSADTGTPTTPQRDVSQTSSTPRPTPSPSPFQQAASTPYSDPNSEPKPSFFAKCCSCFSSPEQNERVEPNSHSGASTPMRTQGQGVQENNRGRSMDRSSRNFMRQSINPLNALVGAIGSVVESVASSGQHETLKNIVRKEKQEDRGYDSDDTELKRGLQKMDSLEFTRARLAKSRQEKRMDALRLLSERNDVDCIIDENAKVSATTILKGVVKNLDAEIVKDVEVVAAKYDINSGEVRVLSRNWYSVQQHTFYSTPA